MTPEQILALNAGPELDQAIHLGVFGGAGKCRPFSTKDAEAIRVMDKLPLFVAAVAANHPGYDPSRPFAAGTLQPEPSVKGDVTALRITASTRAIALCKAALFVVHRPARVERAAPAVTSSDQAKEIAATIGTPAARNRNRPTVAQPAARVHAHDQRQPMPKRPESFVGPQPAKR